MQISQSTFTSEFDLFFEGSGFSIQENIFVFQNFEKAGGMKSAYGKLSWTR